MAIVVNAVLILGMGAIGFALSRNRRRARLGLGVVAVAALAGIALERRPDVAVALFPWRELLFVSNPYPFVVALFLPCAFAFAKTKGQRVRMAILGAVLMGVTFKGYSFLLQPPAVSYEDRVDENGVFRQSGADTCSAAALATLLRRYEIHTNEAEMIAAAWTRRQHGTTRLGLYRALHRQVADRDDLVPRLKKVSTRFLLERNEPAIINVGLPRDPTPASLEFGRKYNWQPGVMHDVAFLGLDPERPGHVRIGEPDYGLESWPVESLGLLFRGFAAYLDERR